MSVGWTDRRGLGARVVLVGLMLALVGVAAGGASPAVEEGRERGREPGVARSGGLERVVVREQAAALRVLFGLTRSGGADEGGRAGPPAVLWVVAVLLGGAWGGQRVAVGGGWRLARRVRATLGSRAPPRVRHA